jgi:hypothetical protein
MSNLMDKVSLQIILANTKVCSKMGRKKEEVFLLGKMARGFKDTMIATSKMEKEECIMQKQR